MGLIKMNSTIQSDLIKVPQTETAGSRSPARFAYQRNWALAELIEYHLEGKDYVFAFEFHDDILILDSEVNPSNLQFVQVKTKTTGQKWTVHGLTKSEKGKNGNPEKLSIIGKLYENKKTSPGTAANCVLSLMHIFHSLNLHLQQLQIS